METGRFSSKGQLVVPKAIRESLNIKPGTEVEFEPVPQGFMVRIPGRLSHEEEVDRLWGALSHLKRGRRGSARTDDEAIVAVVGADDARTKSPPRRRRR